MQSSLKKEILFSLLSPQAMFRYKKGMPSVSIIAIAATWAGTNSVFVDESRPCSSQTLTADTPQSLKLPIVRSEDQASGFQKIPSAFGGSGRSMEASFFYGTSSICKTSEWTKSNLPSPCRLLPILKTSLSYESCWKKKEAKNIRRNGPKTHCGSFTKERTGFFAR